MHDTILPAQMQAAILRQCPKIRIQELEDALDSYRFAGVLAPPVPASERRADLERVAALAQELWEAISALAMSERAKIQEALTAGQKPGIRRARVLLNKIAQAALRAAANIQTSPGRPLDRKVYVIRDIARELHRHGYPIDASSKGPLVFIATELFSLLDGAPQEPRSLVRSALAKMDLKTMDFHQGNAPD
jgi:hypothetical protein